jgi:hypothetical protein
MGSVPVSTFQEARSDWRLAARAKGLWLGLNVDHKARITKHGPQRLRRYLCTDDKFPRSPGNHDAMARRRRLACDTCMPL